MKATTTLLSLSVSLLTLGVDAAPVTDWALGSGGATLQDANTSSPILGNGTADNADNSAIHAAFPSITLGMNEKLTFSGSFQLATSLGAAPSSYANEVRIGVFDVNGSANVNNWLGYYASAPSGTTAAGVRRRNPSSSMYVSQTGTTLLYANALSDDTKLLEDATYDFAFTLERTIDGIELGLTLSNGLGYSLVPTNHVDLAPNTFTFNRVGFLSGNLLNADQIQFSNLDISLEVVPEPTSAALVLTGFVALAATRRMRKQ